MKPSKNKIFKTIKAITLIAERGMDTTRLQDHLNKQIEEISRAKVRVKVGKFGFCTCSEGSGLCCGCWKIKKSCKCAELEVDPKQEMLRQLAANTNYVN